MNIHVILLFLICFYSHGAQENFTFPWPADVSQALKKYYVNDPVHDLAQSTHSALKVICARNPAPNPVMDPQSTDFYFNEHLLCAAFKLTDQYFTADKLLKKKTHKMLLNYLLLSAHSCIEPAEHEARKHYCCWYFNTPFAKNS
ncbi:MAG: hypothetical protein OXC30_01305 [Alphaproteobacteria bacterium]|nr:hypothetical protein [Alphaproteobacteria bacterium]